MLGSVALVVGVPTVGGPRVRPARALSSLQEPWAELEPPVPISPQ